MSPRNHRRERSNVIVTKTEGEACLKMENNIPQQLAHDIRDSHICRTEDILTSEDVDFRSLLLPDFILRGLTAANFHRPSPIQLRSIPLLRLGLDLIVQSKAGTGKTLVIALAALETVKFQSKRLQVIVVAPTREIALQTQHFISTISSDVPVRTEAFIGGTSVKDNKKNLVGCQIAVGTPGRLNSLIESGDISLCHVRLFVLDEADKLMEKPIFSQVKSISKLLPTSKQTILCSATFLQPVKEYVMKHMKEPFWVSSEEASRLQEGNMEPKKSVSTVLLGVKQFMKEVTNHAQIVKKLKYKLEEILEILAGHPFTQCMIFSNYQTRAETICHQLVANGWSAISIRGQDDQSHRTATLTSFKERRCRVLLTTDVMSRGVDFRGVDLVINLDIPYDSATYLHRMGRAGRFGSYGCVVTLASSGEEVESFKKVLSDIDDIVVYNLPSDLQLIKKDQQNCIFFGPSLEKRGKDSKKDELTSNSDCANIKESELSVNEATDDETKKMNGCSTTEHCTSTSFDMFSCEKKRDLVVNNAISHLSDSLCVLKDPPKMLHTFEELEAMCTNWTLHSKDICPSLAPPKDPTKHQDWWVSANILLTAANLELLELKGKNQEKMERDVIASNMCSESSSQQASCEYKKGGTRCRRKKAKTRTKCVKSISDQHTKTPEVHVTTATKEDGDYLWKWDNNSNLYYLWDDNDSCYYLYTPNLEKYFKWYPTDNRYFKWDSHSQSYLLCSHDELRNTSRNLNFNDSSGSYSNCTGSYDDMRLRNYVSWYNLWSKQLRQITSHVYQVEYLKHMCSESKKF